jgi:hypothetical protein
MASPFACRAPGRRLDLLLLSFGDELSIANERRLYSAIMAALGELHDHCMIHGDSDARHILVDFQHAVWCQDLLAVRAALSAMR